MTDAPTAQCPVHPDAPSIGTCFRCGRFVCVECRLQASRLLCHQCAPLLGPVEGLPFRPFGVGASISGGFAVLGATWGRVLLISLPFALLNALSGFAIGEPRAHPEPGDAFTRFGITVGAGLYSVIIGAGGAMCAIAVMAAQVEGERIGVGEALRRGLRAWRRALGPNVVALVQIILLSLLCVIPGIWQAVRLALVNPCVYLVPAEKPRQLSIALTARWWPVCGAFVLASLMTTVPTSVSSIVLRSALHKAAFPFWVAQVVTNFNYQLLASLGAAFTLAMFYGLMVSDGRVNAGAAADSA